MIKDDFHIGLEFYTATGKWRCTDVGTRVIVAIKLDQTDESWYNGPPYAVAEVVFDEYDMPGCSLDPAEVGWESVALSLNPEFMAIIEQARAECRAGKTLSLEEMKRAVLDDEEEEQRNWSKQVSEYQK